MLEIHKKVTNVVKDRKLEDIAKDLPINLKKLAKNDTKNLPKIFVYNNKIIIGNHMVCGRWCNGTVANKTVFILQQSGEWDDDEITISSSVFRSGSDPDPESQSSPHDYIVDR